MPDDRHGVPYGGSAAGDENDDVQLYLNDHYDDRPLSPSLSMYREVQAAGTISQHASNQDDAARAAQGMDAVQGQAGEAGLASVLASMQQQLQALSMQINAMQQNAPLHAHAPCMTQNPAGADNAATMRPSDAEHYVPNSNEDHAAQHALIGMTGLMQRAPECAQGNGTANGVHAAHASHGMAAHARQQAGHNGGSNVMHNAGPLGVQRAVPSAVPNALASTVHNETMQTANAMQMRHNAAVMHNGGVGNAVPAPLAALKAARRPEAFDGRRRNLGAQLWLSTLNTYIQAVPEPHKVTVAATYLTGRALEWYNCAQTELTSYEQFTNAFMQRFVDSTLQDEALQRLATLKQTGSLHSYNALFETTLHMAGISPSDKFATVYYVQGLEPNLQEAVRARLDLLGVQNNYYAARQAADKLIGYRRLAHAHSTSQYSTHTHSAAVMQHDEYDLYAAQDHSPVGRGRGRRSFRGRGHGRSGSSRIPYEHTRCYHCGETGHIAVNCAARQQQLQSQMAQQPRQQQPPPQQQPPHATAASTTAQAPLN